MLICCWYGWISFSVSALFPLPSCVVPGLACRANNFARGVYVGNLSNMHSISVNKTIKHFLLLQPSIKPVPAQVILLWKGPPKLCIECYLVPLYPAKITWMLCQTGTLFLYHAVCQEVERVH